MRIDKELKLLKDCEIAAHKLAVGRCCSVCASQYETTPATTVVFYNNSDNPLVRFELANIIPVCDAHKNVTQEMLPMSTYLKINLLRLSTKNIKGLAIAHGVSVEDILKQIRTNLKRKAL